MSCCDRATWIAAAALLAPARGLSQSVDRGCLLCHPSEAKSLPTTAHAPGTTPFGAEGCFACHEASEDHAASAFESAEGARWTASLREEACETCHAALSASHPPGERRAGACSVCHRVHVPQAPSTRPPEPPANQFGKWQVRSHLETAVRAVSVEGSRTRFRQDTDVDSGPRIREILLEAEPVDGDFPSARLVLEDLGDSFPQGALDVAVSQEVSVSAFARKARLVATASDDVHAYDVDRDEAGARIRLAPEGVPALDLGYSHLVQEGEVTATSNFNVAEPFPPTPACVSSRTDSLDAGLRFDLAGFEIALRERVGRERREEDVSFAAPNPFVPGVTNQLVRDVEDETDVFETLLAAQRDLTEEVEVSFHGRFLDASGDGNLRSREIGAFAGTEFARVEKGDMDTDESEWEIEGTLSFPLAESVRASAFARHEVEDTDATSDVRQVLASPPGTPSTQFDLANGTREESVEDVGGIDLDAQLSESWSLRGGAQAGRERLEVRVRAFNSTIVDRDESLPRLLGYGGATWRPTERLELHFDLQGRRYGALDEFFRETTARGWEAAARARWKPSDPLALGIAARYGRSDVDEFEARNRIATVDLDAAFRPGPDLAAGLLYSRRDEDLASTPTLLTFGGPVSETLDYDAVTDLLGARLEVSLDPRTRSETRIAYAETRGDAHVTTWTFAERLERELREDLTVGLEGYLRRYDPDAPTLEPGYRALVLAAFARWSF